MRLATALLLLLPLAPLAVSGCDSSQAKNKQLARVGLKALKAKGLTVARVNPDIKAVETTVIASRDGAAVVAVLRNASSAAQTSVPISIELRGARGNSVFRNDAPGLERSLVSASVLPAGAEFAWVNDQVSPTAPPKTVKVRIGGGRRLSGPLPKLELSQPMLKLDSTSGVEASGTVVNRSSLEQRLLVIYCVARKGRRIVAAGRAQIERLKASPKKVPYHVFFIGDPRGAQLSVAAPPTVLK